MKKLTQGFSNKVITFSQTINQQNFSTKYNELIKILVKFNTHGLLKDEIEKSISNILNEQNFSEYQAEVFSEILRNIQGFCSPNKTLDLL